MKLLLELISQVTANQDLRDVVRAVMTNIRRMLHSDGAIFLLRDQDSGELLVYALDLPSGAGTLREGTIIAFEGTVAGRVFQSGKAWTGTVQEARTLSPGFDAMLSGAGFRVSCKLPILSRNRVIGALALGRSEGGRYDQDDLELLERVSNHIAMAVENALAFEEIKTLKERLAREDVTIDDEIRNEDRFDEIVGKSAALRRVLPQVETVAPTDATVLICGETGTGKKLIASAIHNLNSPSRK